MSSVERGRENKKRILYLVNGLTIRNAVTGKKNHSTTLWKVVWRHYGNITDETQRHRGTTDSPTPRQDVHKGAQQSMTGSRGKGVEGPYLTENRLTDFRNKKPAVQIQGRRCTPPPTARALFGTPSGGRYPDPGYQHNRHLRLFPHQKSSV